MLAHLTTAATIANGPELYGLVAAALVLAIGALGIAAPLLEQRGVLPASAVQYATWTSVLAAGLSLGSSAIHFAVIGEHFAEYAPYGVAFTVFAWFQVGWAFLYVVRTGRRLATLAIVINVGALIVWAVSRFVGLPFGPEAGALEAIGPLDVMAGVLELALIVLLGWNLAAASGRWRPGLSPASAIAYVGSAMLAVVVVTSWAFAATAGSGHSGAEHGEAAETGEAHESPPGDAASGGSEAAPGGSDAAPAPTAPIEQPGTIVFGSGLDLAGDIQGLTATFRSGQTATWLAELSEPPDAPSVRFMIFQVLPDGREVEHWRQDLPVIDPGGRQLVGMADLSVYVHGGAGDYRMRYFRGDQMLAEGAFDFLP